jgi:hypothetical protein
MRKTIDPFKNMQAALFEMGEGNPGAISAMIRCIEVEGQMAFMIGTILHLDDMNIRGSQIWIAYKDYCAHGDDALVHSDKHVKLFIECVKRRDPMMILAVNQAGLKGYTSLDKAVESGASYRSIGRKFLTEEDKSILNESIIYPKLDLDR